MKKWCMGIYIGLFCLLLYGRTSVCGAEEVFSQTAEVVILIDTSGSVYDYKEEIVDWAQDFIFHCMDKNITVSCITFDNQNAEKCVIDRVQTTEGNLNSTLNNLDLIAFEGNYTDQYGAFQKAKDQLQQSNKDFKSIIMLSDGKLEYENDPNGVTAEASEIQLTDSCKNFTEQPNQNVIVVGFEKNNDKVIPLFKEMEANGAKYISKDFDPFEILSQFFDEMGIHVRELKTDEMGEELVGFIDFSVINDCDEVIVIIKNIGDDQVKPNADELSVRFTEKDSTNERAVSDHNVKIICVNKLAYIKLKSPPKGAYHIVLPSARWKYKVTELRNTYITSVTLQLYDGEKKLEPLPGEKDGLTCYQLEPLYKELKLRVTFNTEDTGARVNPDEVYYKYINQSDGTSWEQVEENWMVKNSDGEWVGVLESLDKEKNVYKAAAVVSGSPIESDLIQILMPDEDVKIVSNEAVIQEKKEFSTLIPKEYEDRINQIAFFIEETELLADTEADSYQVDEDGTAITFLKADKYEIDVRDLENVLLAKAIITVREPGILDKLIECWVYIAGVLLGIVILVAIIVKNRKSSNK